MVYNSFARQSSSHIVFLLTSLLFSYNCTLFFEKEIHVTQIPASIFSELVARYGFTPAQMEYFSGGHEWSDGILFEYKEANPIILLKFMVMPLHDFFGIERLQERLRFASFLGKNQVPMVFPTSSQNGNLFEQIDDHEKRYVVYAMEKLPGGEVGHPDDYPAFYFQWGQVIGHLHHVSQQFGKWQGSGTKDEKGRDILDWESEMRLFAKWCQDDDVRKKWYEIHDELKLLPQKRNNFGFIHNDPHRMNLLLHNNQITLLDFDVANYHWFLNDIAIVWHSECMGLKFRKLDAETIKACQAGMVKYFLQGYRSQNEFPDAELAPLSTFLQYRRIIMFTVFYNELLKKPDSLKHWKEEILENEPVMSLL
jgi:Ser/Thr protein kinase RdoA (MazF antagonist)